MARILFTWELGGGMGHIAPYLALIRGLRDKGHEIAFVLRNLRFAETTLGKDHIPYFQAPVLLAPVEDEIQNPHTFAQILHNVGYGNIELLTGMAKAWQQLFRVYQPDLVVFDHSPTALLAARTTDCKKIVIGPGFFIPPDVTPLPLLRTNPLPDMAVVASDEARILANINRVLSRLDQPPLARITQLYQADDTIFTTLKELDHYPQRKQNDNYYSGISRAGLGSEPVWPPAEGRRIFAYLKPFKTLPVLLQRLQQLNASVVIYAPEFSDAQRRQFASSTFHFSREPLDLEKTAHSCDLAITNCTHATNIFFLLAGKPLLLLPIYLEQVIQAHILENLGVARNVFSRQPQEMVNKLQELLDDPSYRLAAEDFAKRYCAVDAVLMEQQLIDRVERLLATIGQDHKEVKP